MILRTGDRRHPAGRGFTLIELVVAIAVFAVASTLAYQGLASVMLSREHITEKMERFGEVQRAVSLLTQDIQQVVPRAIRDERGDAEPSFLLKTSRQSVLTFSRGGWPEMPGQAQSSLRRLSYALEGDRLTRSVQQRLDRGPGAVPNRADLLKQVTAFEVSVLDDRGRWLKDWPAAGESEERLAKAVKLRLVIKDFGELQRLIVLQP